MLPQIWLVCADVRALLPGPRHMYSSQGGMGGLLLGACQPSLSGALVRTTTKQNSTVLIAFQTASDHTLFLEKIADMLEAVASLLPRYHDIYAICKRRVESPHIIEDERLTTLMSYVYLDIVKLLLDTYRIFFRQPQGTHRFSRKDFAYAI